MTMKFKTKKQAIKFLTEHEVYYKMNPWNQTKSYAKNIKVYNLNLTKEQEDKAYDIINFSDYYNAATDIIQDSKMNCFWNGRSGGYLVLDSYNGHKIEMIDKYDLEEMTKAEVIEMAEIVAEFDELVEELIDLFKYYCDHARIETETVMVPSEHKYLTFDD